MTHVILRESLAGWLQKLHAEAKERAEAEKKASDELVKRTLRYGPEEVGALANGQHGLSCSAAGNCICCLLG